MTIIEIINFGHCYDVRLILEDGRTITLTKQGGTEPDDAWIQSAVQTYLLDFPTPEELTIEGE